MLKFSDFEIAYDLYFTIQILDLNLPYSHINSFSCSRYLFHHVLIQIFMQNNSLFPNIFHSCAHFPVPVSNFTNRIEKACTVSYTYKSFEIYKLLLVIRFLFSFIF